MTDALAEIRTHLRAAECALAKARGGSSELARLREAACSLLLAVQALAALCEAQRVAARPAAREPARRRRRET